MQNTRTETLQVLADNLKQDAKALFHHNRPEAMRLFRSFCAITRELHRREFLAKAPHLHN